MAKAKKLPSGSWRVRVYSHDEIRGGKTVKVMKSITVDDPTPRGRRECERLAAEWAARKNTERITASSVTVGEAIDRCIKSKRTVLSPSTLRSYDGLRAHAYAALEDVKVGELTQEDVQIWLDGYAKTHSPKTCRNAHGLLVSALAMFRPGLTLRTRLPQPVPVEYRTPSDVDVSALIDATRGTDLGRAILLAAFGTLRAGEICALTVGDVNVNDRTVTVSTALAVRKGGGTVVKQPKNPASVRKVVYPEAVIRELRTVKSGRLVDIHPNNLAWMLHRVQKKIGVMPFRFHDLRAYSASIMHALGVPDAYIMSRGGWKTDATLKKVYRRTMEDEEKRMTEKVNDYFQKLMN